MSSSAPASSICARMNATPSAFVIQTAVKARPTTMASTRGASHRGRAATARKASPGAMKTSQSVPRNPRSAGAAAAPSLITERLDGIEARRLVRGPDPEPEADGERGEERDQHPRGLDDG